MQKPRRPKIGLALGAGGARGWAHIGAIRALNEQGIRPDIVCGTSMGSLVGAAYAAGELERLEEWALTLGWRDVFGLMDFSWRGGLLRGKKLFEFMRARFGVQDIDSLPMPYGAVATELATGREVWLRHGHVLDAVRASMRFRACSRQCCATASCWSMARSSTRCRCRCAARSAPRW